MNSAVGPRLELRQSQSLVMTQQLQQSIKLLQLSSLELAEYIDQELEKNPLLAVDEVEPGQDVGEDRGDNNEEQTDHSETYGDPEDKDSATERATDEGRGNAEEDWEHDDSSNDEAFVSEDSGLHYANVRTSSDEDDGQFEPNITKAISLREHLQEQLVLGIEDPVSRMIGLHLIDMLSEAGYVPEDFAQVASILECDVALVQETLLKMQSFDPVGIFARNLAECLALQLQEKDRYDPAMQKLVANLDLIAKGDMAGLRKVCGVDDEDLKLMIAEIRELNPRPASGFVHDVVQTVIPDIFLKRTKSGGWQIELNSSVLPKVLVNRQYYSMLSAKTRDKVEKKYLTDQLATASWLVKALDQRAQTILKVTTEIVSKQDSFFRHGIRYLKPMTLREVAEQVELHESTVSRVTSNKYISTPRGNYELKYFFTSSISNSSGGEDYSSRTVMHLIKQMVDEESPGKILSDDALSEMLKDRGIDCARRTVTKYREAMNLGSSVQRRREKASQK